MTRRLAKIAKLAAAALVLAVSSTAALAAFPERPITLVVPAAAGGQTDAIARIVAAHMAKTLGQPIVVESRLERRHCDREICQDANRSRGKRTSDMAPLPWMPAARMAPTKDCSSYVTDKRCVHHPPG